MSSKSSFLKKKPKWRYSKKIENLLKNNIWFNLTCKRKKKKKKLKYLLQWQSNRLWITTTFFPSYIFKRFLSNNYYFRYFCSNSLIFKTCTIKIQGITTNSIFHMLKDKQRHHRWQLVMDDHVTDVSSKEKLRLVKCQCSLLSLDTFLYNKQTTIQKSVWQTSCVKF